MLGTATPVQTEAVELWDLIDPRHADQRGPPLESLAPGAAPRTHQTLWPGPPYGGHLNLVYHDTQDEQVYQVLSRRLPDKFDIFGGLPDTIEDDWLESVEKLAAMMDTYIHLRQQGRDVFALRYKDTIDPDKHAGNCAPACWRERMSSRNSRNPGSGIARVRQVFPPLHRLDLC